MTSPYATNAQEPTVDAPNLDLDDAALVSRISAGDTLAEQALVRRFSRPVQVMLLQRCRDSELAQDLHQETFRVLIEKLRRDGLDDPSRLAAYTHRTALNLWKGHARKTQRRNTWTDMDAVGRLADTREQQLDTLLRAEEASAVRQLLYELKPERDREILRRFYLLQQEKPVICRDLDLSATHFDRVIYRARQRFKKLVVSRLGAHADLSLVGQEQ